MKMVDSSFFITNFCYIFSIVNGIEKPDIWTFADKNF